MAAIDSIFKIIKEQGASDLHMATGSKPMVRLNSELVPVETAALPGTSRPSRALDLSGPNMYDVAPLAMGCRRGEGNASRSW